ncbi:hypothetical protein [Spiroplasma corruscae]|nr:hypothetical protein [Spiroplasma corruscae]
MKKLHIRLKSLCNSTSSPEYFFYKYYFLFIYKSRHLLMNIITNEIIPSILKLELPINIIEEYEELVHLKSLKPDLTIETAFLKIKNKMQNLFKIINSECDNEVLLKGENWVANYKEVDILFTMFPFKHFDNILFNEKFVKLAKKFRINMSNFKEENIIKLIDILKENNVLFDEENLKKLISYGG